MYLEFVVKSPSNATRKYITNFLPIEKTRTSGYTNQTFLEIVNLVSFLKVCIKCLMPMQISKNSRSFLKDKSLTDK